MATIFGGNGKDEIDGTSGNDVIYAGNGKDEVDAGDGNDIIYGGNGKDEIEGGDGDDTAFGGNSPDELYGGAGNDSLDGGSSGDELYGGDGNDSIDGGSGDDEIEGGDGDDTIDGGQGQDEIEGGDGNDSIDGGSGDDEIEGGDGDDVIDGGEGQDEIEGGDGNDTLDAGDADGNGRDELYGGDGDDTLISGGNGDELFGGDDDDTFIIQANGNGVFNDLDIFGGSGSDTLDLSELREIYPDLEIIYESGSPGSSSGTILVRTEPGGQQLGRINFSGMESIDPVICFTPGVMVATKRGRLPVEALRPGDMIVTRDNGLQELAWVGRRDLGVADLCVAPQHAPIRIRAGALGNGFPDRDLVVSPQHRILMQGHVAELYFHEPEVLAAAVHLVGRPGVERLGPVKASYIHLMFEKHEILSTNGCWTESFQPGSWSMSGLGEPQRNEILSLFPELADAPGLEDFGAARRVLRGYEASVFQRA
ncbi:Hint domain-containing protein [Ponticoccus sp. SC2-23]|nr:Hint domain-containing protein [Ponticoccus sp. SC6-9]MBM1224043.1 Hint domain-containing protein [Ponticoccus sp. SC6-15]MBM1230178.1 Hint domain-containing protein [Ponticoccus sp. SC6-38]MBM1233009.1 Hint domain-containing protein [Ponticoccus sp. SC6-45]MBM1237041.1 Hint domain-containing protein [Ponticoccus sp. SC6-49]MBM1242020.1 Hint domain-containing protein [Ponticoccus sp. SC2-64]MBM1246533.1 Hint domain-containing protein [Ponticoccus sp. SC6-42]MBM1251011.1 Hint domain-contai